MKFTLMLECKEHPGGIGGLHDSQPVPLSEPIANIYVDEDQSTYKLTSNGEQFKKVVGPVAGELQKSYQDLILTNFGTPVLWLPNFYINSRRRVFGTANWKLDPNGAQWNAWTFYRRKLHPLEMTKDERTEEMLGMMKDGIFYQELGSQLGDFFGPVNLAQMAAILGLFAACPVSWFFSALFLLMGGITLAIQWETYAPYWQIYNDRRAYSKDEADLREGAHALAIVLAAIITQIVTLAVMDEAGRRVPIERLRDVFNKKGREEWEAAKTQAREIEQRGSARLPKADEAPWDPPEDVGTKDWIRRTAAEAQKLERLADAAAKRGDKVTESQLRLGALENWIQAEKEFQFLRDMSGHSQVVQDLCRFYDRELLPKLKGKDATGIKKMFEDDAGVKNLTQQQAELLREDAASTDPGAVTRAAKGHDFRDAPGSKNRHRVSGGMKLEHTVLTEKEMETLREAMAESDPDARAKLLLRFLENPNRSDYPNDAAYNAAIKRQQTFMRWWQMDIFEENIESSRRATKGVINHNTGEPHHDPKSGAEWTHHGVDAYQSKVMIRSYQKNPLSIEAEVKPWGTEHDQAVIKLGQYIVRMYLKAGGKFSKADIMDCSRISKLTRKSCGF